MENASGMTPGELVITTDRVGVFPSVLDGGRNIAPPLVGISTTADAETRDPRVPGAAAGATRWQVDGKYLARGGVKRVPRGVTYGPFPPNPAGEPFPAPQQVRADFKLMLQAGIDCVRTYWVPPDWFFDLAQDCGIGVFVDIPWSKHLCFLDSSRARSEARQAVRRAAEVGRRFTSVLGYSIGNEIPADVIRWHGADRVSAFLGTLAAEVKQTDPAGLVTYANFPPTEYLDLSFLDFATFNVYLHDLETFHRYLLRLQNIVGDKPLVLGELGMDTLRHGDEAQATFLEGHLREAVLLGLAGTFVFSWTDVWHTGGHLIDDWAFGITRADRSAKPAYRAIASLPTAPADMLPHCPRVSVVVCCYNGGRTLAQCLESLQQLRYPNYEVILVDDGSTDDTAAIAARFPDVIAIHQENKGLSESRNVGLRAATGGIIAYTDADCFADPDWLSHLVHQLDRTKADAVGGPNISPDDGWLAACVNASPGQPTHVLESDQVAEHVPGCNMAFRREALETINGFDPQFHRAGDDVDICWRLQQAGGWITFAAGAFVWHHRRPTPQTYFRQQSGYGEAEALLRFKHPEKFNGRGAWKWRGVLYGVSLRGLQMRESLVYRGTFGTGLFQCLYQPPSSHWAMIPTTLEWHIAAGLVALNAIAYRPAGIVAAVMIAISVLVAFLQAVQARLPNRYEGLFSRVVIAFLSYRQPLVRSWAHYQSRLSSYRAISAHPLEHRGRHPLRSGRWGDIVEYWSEHADDRTHLLQGAIRGLRANRWGITLDTGWSEWDAEVFGHPWTCLRLTTVQEEHGSGRRLIRLRYRFSPTWLSWIALTATVGSVGLAAYWLPGFAVAVGAVATLAALGIHRHGVRLAAQILDEFDGAAKAMGLTPCRQADASRTAP